MRILALKYFLMSRYNLKTDAGSKASDQHEHIEWGVLLMGIWKLFNNSKKGSNEAISLHLKNTYSQCEMSALISVLKQNIVIDVKETIFKTKKSLGALL